MLSYPDERAVSITVYSYAENKSKRMGKYKLTRHEFLPLAYYLNDELAPVSNSGSSATLPDYDNSPIQILIDKNKLKVSELNNPFFFPNKNTYQISNGEILNMASNATSISEGQFGEYPLYVFTSEGIYSLKVGEGEVAYSNRSAPASHETPVTPFVCPTPFGVVFASARGLCIVAGREVTLLTPQLQQNPAALSIQADTVLEGVLPDYGRQSFTEFLKNTEGIVYNPHENELVVFDREAEYNYVYCFDSQQFYLSTEKFDGVVQNTFPDLLVIDDKKIKDYSQSQSPDTHVSLITRPLTFGTPDLKRLERMILRASLFNIQNPAEGKKSVFLNYCSMDGANFRILRGIPLAPSSRKDIDTGMFARSKFRQFMLAFGGVVDEKSEIGFLETEIEREYQNTKMR